MFDNIISDVEIANRKLGELLWLRENKQQNQSLQR